MPSCTTATTDRRLIELARHEVESIVADLPEDVRQKADDVPVAYELDFPDHWAEDGVEPDSLGLFSGPSCTELDDASTPEVSLISLFLMNIWKASDLDEQTYLDEVRLTYLHELGHYLGLEEDDMGQRGLL